MVEPRAELQECSPLTIEMLAAIKLIEPACFEEGIACLEDDIESLCNISQICLVATVGDEIVGYALGRHAFGVGYLYSNAVLPQFRSRGIGSRLLQARLTLMTVAGCKRVIAHTKVDNVMSAKLLAAHRFAATEFVPDFYGDNLDGVKWECSL